MTNKEVLHRVTEDGKIVHTIKGRKTNWTGHSLQRNCVLEYVIEGKVAGRIEVTGRRRRRYKQLLNGLKQNISC